MMADDSFITMLPDIPRIITGMAEWLSCMACIFAMRRKLAGGKLAAVCILFFFIQNVFMTVTGGMKGAAWWLCMTAAACLMFLFIAACTDITKRAAVCYTSTAFIASEFAASLEWQIHCYIAELFDMKNIFLQAALAAVVYAVVFFVIWQLNIHISALDEKPPVTVHETILIAFSALIVFAVSNLGFLPVETPFTGRDSIETFNMRTLIDLGGLAMHYAHQAQWKSSLMRRELDSIHTILHNQYEQYKQAQRTIDLINYRYHDLKNHIITLRAGGDAPQGEYLDKLEQEIHSYEALNKISVRSSEMRWTMPLSARKRSQIRKSG